MRRARAPGSLCVMLQPTDRRKGAKAPQPMIATAGKGCLAEQRHMGSGFHATDGGELTAGSVSQSSMAVRPGRCNLTFPPYRALHSPITIPFLAEWLGIFEQGRGPVFNSRRAARSYQKGTSYQKPPPEGRGRGTPTPRDG